MRASSSSLNSGEGGSTVLPCSSYKGRLAMTPFRLLNKPLDSHRTAVRKIITALYLSAHRILDLVLRRERDRQALEHSLFSLRHRVVVPPWVTVRLMSGSEVRVDMQNSSSTADIFAAVRTALEIPLRATSISLALFLIKSNGRQSQYKEADEIQFSRASLRRAMDGCVLNAIMHR